jgi:uncharacterized protein
LLTIILRKLAVPVLVLGLLASCSRAPVELTLVTPREPIDKGIADELVDVFSANPKIRLTLVPFPDIKTSSLEALAAGTGDLALVSNGEDYVRGVETVIPLYPTVLHIAYQDRLHPKDRNDLLIGTSVYAGLPGSASRDMMEEIVHHLGIPADDVHFVESLVPKPDVVVVFAPIIPGLMDNYTDYRLFTLGTVDELGHGSPVEAISLLRPQFQPFVIPTDIYPTVVNDPVVTVGVDELIVARSDLPAAVVYDLIRELVRLKPALAAVQPGLFHKLTGDFDTTRSTFVIHPGAQAYMERDAPSAYERYSGVAEVAMTLFFSVISGGYAALRVYRIRRKNRIDTFYKRAIAIRKAVPPDADRTMRGSAIDEIRSLQEIAFDLLVDEKLAADESFRIFVTLCNDIITDLRT